MYVCRSGSTFPPEQEEEHFLFSIVLNAISVLHQTFLLLSSN